MWGVVPAAGVGSRIQPLAFSKELLPVGSHREGPAERPRAVSEYLLDRMHKAGADKVCFVISPSKSDIVEYFGGRYRGMHIAYAVQEEPRGLVDAVCTSLPMLAPDEDVLLGLPDTVWFPDDGLARVSCSGVGLLLFPVAHPEHFDAVAMEQAGRVTRIEVKQSSPSSHWVWGAMRMGVSTLRELHTLWLERGREDLYLGTLLNAYIAQGGEVVGVRAGQRYVDVGTLGGYRDALTLLSASTS